MEEFCYFVLLFQFSMILIFALFLWNLLKLSTWSPHPKRLVMYLIKACSMTMKAGDTSNVWLLVFRASKIKNSSIYFPLFSRIISVISVSGWELEWFRKTEYSNLKAMLLLDHTHLPHGTAENTINLIKETVFFHGTFHIIK